jgi:hypothetical protein
MTRSTSTLSILLFALLVATPAAAQVRKGLNEIGGTFAIDADDSSEPVWSVDLSLLYGRFVTERLQLGANVGLFEANDQDIEGDYRGFAAYHFGGAGKTMVPYVEAGVGSFFGGGGDHPLFVSGGPGLKVFFGGGGGAIDLTALYRRMFDLPGTTGKNGFNFNVGVSVFFE